MDVVVKRASDSDRQAVLSINEDIYWGMDYLSAKYTEFAHSRRYMMYKAELDGQVARISTTKF